MKKKISGLIVAIICIGLVVGAYYYLSSSRAGKNVENGTELTEVEKVLAKDLDKSYPMTPREVVTFYNRILGCLYNEEYTDDQLHGLSEKMRMLMDEELKEVNMEDEFFENLKKEAASFALQGKKIATTTVSDSNDVQYKTVGGRECAYVNASYFMKEGDNGDFSRTTQCYVLRKDEAENWKILGFSLVGGED